MRILVITLSFAIAVGLCFTASAQDLDVELQRAVQRAVTTGDLDAAIEEYRDIVARAGSNRGVAARALIQMAESYQTLGDAEARRIYEQVVREYADQDEAVTVARARLAALGLPATASDTLSVRRVWEPDNGGIFGGTSLDGRYLSVTAPRVSNGLFVRDLVTGDTRDLADPDTSLHPGTYALFSTMSPDGRQVAYSWGPTPTDGVFELRLVSVTGERQVLYSNPAVAYLEPGGWSPDGTHVLAFLAGRPNNNRIAVISVANGTVRVVKNLGWRQPKGLKFSPDGCYIVYDTAVEQDSPLRDIFILAADGRELTLVAHPSNDRVLGWAPDGKQLLFASTRTGSASAFTIAVAEGRPQGEPQLVKPDIGSITPLGITEQGALYYSIDSGGSNVQIATLDPTTGDVLAPASPASDRFVGRNSSAAWSPDGRYLAYFSRGGPAPFKNGPRSIRILSVENGEERVLSPRLASFYTAFRPRWSPDGRFLLVSAATSGGDPGLFQIDVGTGEVTLLTTDVSRHPYGEWSADGRSIYYVRRALGIHLRDLETGQEQEIYQLAPRPLPAFPIRHLALSPDGEQLAFLAATGAEDGDWRLLVTPVVGGDAREVLNLEGLISGLEWTPDGRYLLFSRQDGLWRIPSSGGTAQRLDVPGPAEAGLSLHPDGRRLAFTTVEQKLEMWVMENFLPAVEASQ